MTKLEQLVDVINARMATGKYQWAHRNAQLMHYHGGGVASRQVVAVLDLLCELFPDLIDGILARPAPSESA